MFDSLPPTFVWSKEDVSEYYLMVFKDSLWSKDTLLWDTLADTNFTLLMSDFASADSGAYKWTVAVSDTATGELLYPSPRSFSIKEYTFPLDLDTTYFPFGLGYEWCYDQIEYSHYWQGWVPDTSGRTYTYDTLIISVVDSTGSPDSLVFHLNGYFNDVSDFVVINNYRIQIFGGDSISLIPRKEEITIPFFFLTYKEDTLNIWIEYSNDDISYYEEIDSVSRIKGIGSIYQKYWFRETWTSHTGYSVSEVSIEDRLLWFYNGKDTVYKAP